MFPLHVQRRPLWRILHLRRSRWTCRAFFTVVMRNFVPDLSEQEVDDLRSPCSGIESVWENLAGVTSWEYRDWLEQRTLLQSSAPSLAEKATGKVAF
jgi:hypothetical protein